MILADWRKKKENADRHATETRDDEINLNEKVSWQARTPITFMPKMISNKTKAVMSYTFSLHDNTFLPNLVATSVPSKEKILAKWIALSKTNSSLGNLIDRHPKLHLEIR